MIGTKIYCYEYWYEQGTKRRRSSRNNYTESTYEVVAENDEFVCISDHFLSTLQKMKNKDQDYRTIINEPVSNVYVNDNFWGNAVHYKLYSTEPVLASDIKKHIEKAVKKDKTFKVVKQFTLDKVYLVGQIVTLSDEQTIKNLISQKLIK